MNDHLPSAPFERIKPRIRLFLLCRCRRHLVIDCTVSELTDRVEASGWQLATAGSVDHDVCPACQSEERAA